MKIHIQELSFWILLGETLSCLVDFWQIFLPSFYSISSEYEYISSKDQKYKKKTLNIHFISSDQLLQDWNTENWIAALFIFLLIVQHHIWYIHFLYISNINNSIVLIVSRILLDEVLGDWKNCILATCNTGKIGVTLFSSAIDRKPMFSYQIR